MAYANHYVASIIHNNKIQREFNKNGERTVTLPFDSEYAIRVQNKHFLKASVDILIDGISIFSAGKTLLLNPGQTINVERFVDDLKGGRKFKFVSKEIAITEGHQDPTSSDFGTVSITFTPQRVVLNTLDTTTILDSGWKPSPSILRNANTFYSSAMTNNSTNINTLSCVYDGPIITNAVDFATPTSNIGGTVEGSESKQTFQQSNEVVDWDYDNSTTIKMRLVGEVKVVNPFPDRVYIDGKNYTFHWSNKNPDGTYTVQYK